MERSHATDDMEFYQLLTYTGDVDLNRRLKEWEDYYNFHRPHGSLRGRAPYEVLKAKLKTNKTLSPEVVFITAYFLKPNLDKSAFLKKLI